MKITPMFAWYDFWIGLFYDRTKKRLYIFPLPMLGVAIQFDKVDEYRTFFPKDDIK